MPLMKKNKKISFTPSQSIFKYMSGTAFGLDDLSMVTPQILSVPKCSANLYCIYIKFLDTQYMMHHSLISKYSGKPYF